MSSPSEQGDGGPGAGLEAVISERRQLISLAYRLLGSLAEAEDAVQETYARWYGLSREQPGLVGQQDGITTTVLAFDIAGDKITRIWAIRNPDKLRPWTTR